MHRSITLPSFAFLTAAIAQNAGPVLPYLPEEKDAQHVAAVKMPMGAPKGITYYLEAFETGQGEWTVEDPVQPPVPWVWTTEGPSPTSSTYPVPALNTTTGGWMMLDDDALGQENVPSESWLISPVIDLSAAPPNLQLEFDQYFQEWNTGQDHVFVGVSTDGSDWSEVEVNQGVGRDGRPNPEGMDLDISAWVGASPSTVQLRFRYTASWAYGWQVDNVRITDLPNNNMALIDAHRTLFDFTGTGSEAQPYTIYPAEHTAPMEMHLRHKNKGYLSQSNVTSNVMITGPGGDDFTSSSAVANVAPGVMNEVVFEPFVPDGSVGAYEVSFSVQQNETDEVPEDNISSTSFEVSAHTYALDHGDVDGLLRPTAEDLDQVFEVGNKFLMRVDDEVVAIQVAVHEATPPGGEIYGAMYLLAPDLITHPGFVEQTNPHTLEPNQLSAPGTANFITLTFTNPVPVSGGETYMVMAGATEPADSVRFATSGFLPGQIALIHYPFLPTGFLFTTTKAPMVRAVMASGPVGIVEPGGGLSVIQAGPSPFDHACDLRFELARPADVRVELHDMSGRAVVGQSLGRLGIGQQNFRIDGDQLTSGSYLYSVIIDGVRRTGTVMKY